MLDMFFLRVILNPMNDKIALAKKEIAKLHEQIDMIYERLVEDINVLNENGEDFLFDYVYNEQLNTQETFEEYLEYFGKKLEDMIESN